MLTLPPVRASKLFDATTVTREEIVDLLRRWGYDHGAIIHGLLLQIAELRGFEPITVVDIYPDRNHGWEVLPCETLSAAQQLVGGCCDGDTQQYRYLGCHDSHRGKKYFVLSWRGAKPSHDLVNKKMKQYGARDDQFYCKD